MELEKSLQGLLQAILEDPDSDDLRLIYADCLEELGQIERAEFIRVQIELARLNVDNHSIEYWDGQLGPGPKYYQEAKSLLRRERELLTKNTTHKNEWSGFPPELSPTTSWKFHRGFVEEITLSVEDWAEYHEKLLALQPIQGVGFSNWQYYHRFLTIGEEKGIWPTDEDTWKSYLGKIWPKIKFHIPDHDIFEI